MAAFASLDQVQARLDWTLDADEERVATAALDDASDLARYYGKEWDATTAPRMVQTYVLRAVVRYMKNPEGLVTARAGDETSQWAERPGLGDVTFTEEEIKALKALAGRGGLGSIPVVAWGPQKPKVEGFVPVEGGGYVQFFSSDTSPW